MKKLLLILCAFVVLVNVYSATDKKKRRQERREAFLRRQSKQAAIPKGWLTSIEEARKNAEKENKPMFILITNTQSSNACRTLDRKVIQKPEFQSELKNYVVAVYLDAPKNSTDETVVKALEKCTFFNGEIPCIAVVDSEMKVLARPKSMAKSAIISAAKEGSRILTKRMLQTKRNGDGEEAPGAEDKGASPKENSKDESKEKAPAEAEQD